MRLGNLGDDREVDRVSVVFSHLGFLGFLFIGLPFRDGGERNGTVFLVFLLFSLS